MMRRPFLAGFTMFFWVAGLAAQVDLVALQKKEQERRKNTKPSVLSLNNASRAERFKGKGRYSVTVFSGKKSQSGETEGVNAQAQAAEEDQKRELWISRWQDMKSQIEHQKEKMNKLQQEIDRTIFSRTQESNPVNYQRHTDRLNELELDMKAEKRNLEELGGALEELLVQARREGVPPGWFRD